MHEGLQLVDLLLEGLGQMLISLGFEGGAITWGKAKAKFQNRHLYHG